MFNAKDLLGALMDGGLSGSSRGRVDHAIGDQGLGGQGGGLEQLLSGFGGSGGGAADMLGGLAQGAKSLFGDAQQAVKSGNPLAIGGLGALAGALMGGGSSSVKGALGGTALAMLGSLAMQALQGSRDGRASQVDAAAATPAGMRPPINAAEEQDSEDQAMLILRAMINAAKADGHVDEHELNRIVGKLRDTGADEESQAFVTHAFHQPMETESIILAAADPVTSAEVYAASLLAIEVDTYEERTYLAQLSQSLGLNEGVVQRIHATLGVSL